MPEPIFIIVPVALAIAIVLILGWLAEMRRRKRETQRRVAEQVRQARIQQAHLPAGAASIATDGADRQLQEREHLVGGYLLVSVGTFGLNQLERLLKLLDLCGLERLVGSILVIENDVQLRAKFHQPTVQRSP